MGLRVAELETLFTADVRPFEKSAVKVEIRRKDLAKVATGLRITADDKPALAGLARVEAEGRKITAKDVVATIDTNITKAEKGANAIRAQLAVLEATDPMVEVQADVTKAQSNLSRIEASLEAMRGARATLEVQADTSKAESALDDVAKKAGDAGAQGGKDAGQGLSAGIVAAIATIPIAGAVVGIGAAIGKSLMDGLQVEVRSDLLTAQTGLDPVTVAKIARAAGEAYAGNFGVSISENMQTARAAIQSGLLDPVATARDSQQVIASLDGVATILGEDIPRVSRSAAQLLRTGLARDAAGAFDIIVKGSQAGLNVSEDWLDTLDEYSTQFRVIGLDGPQAIGLLSQAVKAGARDTDTAADALKEFAIRATDGSATSKTAFEGIGLSAQEMAAQISAGGPTAAAALDLTLDRLRAVEDPALRAQLAVGLFGTKAEDLGAALFAMDLTTATDQLGQVAGAAQSAVDALGDNAAGSIESAQRNIEVAADGIKGALATALNPQIEGFATFVSENREAVITFLLDVANGGLNAGRALVNGAADATEAFGDFVGSAGPQVLGLIRTVIEGYASLAGALDPTGVLGIKDAAWEAADQFNTMRVAAEEGFASFDKSSGEAADAIRTNLIENGIDPAQQKLNEVAIPMIAQAAVHDASMRLAQSIDSVGYAADGTTRLIDGLTVAADGTATASTQLDAQLRAVAAALADETDKGRVAGETQAELTARYEEGRQALILQLEQMGLTTAQAVALADSYGAVPGTVSTMFLAETAAAQTSIDEFIARNTGKIIRLKAEVSSSGQQVYATATGARLEAAGDTLSPRPRRAMSRLMAPATA